jgi:hypothetical protein
MAIASTRWTQSVSDLQRDTESVTQGKRAMPACGGILKPGELEASWVYVGSVNGW